MIYIKLFCKNKMKCNLLFIFLLCNHTIYSKCKRRHDIDTFFKIYSCKKCNNSIKILNENINIVAVYSGDVGRVAKEDRTFELNNKRYYLPILNKAFNYNFFINLKKGARLNLSFLVAKRIKNNIVDYLLIINHVDLLE